MKSIFNTNLKEDTLDCENKSGITSICNDKNLYGVNVTNIYINNNNENEDNYVPEPMDFLIVNPVESSNNISLEDLSSTCKYILNLIRKMISALITSLTNFIKWLRNNFKENQKQNKVIETKVKNILSLPNKDENYKIPFNDVYINQFVSPDTNLFNIPESIHSCLNILKELIKDDTNINNAEKIISLDFNSLINYDNFKNIIIKPPFTEFKIKGKDRSAGLTDYIGPVLPGGYRLSASLPTVDGVNFDNQNERRNYFNAMNLATVGFLKEKPVTIKNKQEVFSKNNELVVNEGELKIIMSSYTELCDFNIQVINKLEKQEKLAIQIKNKMKNIQDEITYNKNIKFDKEINDILHESLYLLTYVAKTFREPLYTVSKICIEKETILRNVLKTFINNFKVNN